MADDLIDFKERLQAQRVHIDRFLYDQAAFIETTVRLEARPSRPGEHDVFMTQAVPINTFLRSYSGMIAHEIRACLDGLTSALARRNAQDPGTTTYFPIAKTESDYRKYATRALRRVSDADRRTIDAFSPWLSRNPILYGLHEADRSRKHQRLYMSATGSDVSIGGVISGDGHIHLTGCSVPGGVVRNFHSVPYLMASRGKVGQEVQLLSGAPDGVEVRLTLHLVYSEGEGIENEPIVPSLIKFADQVETIIQAFD